MNRSITLVLLLAVIDFTSPAQSDPISISSVPLGCAGNEGHLQTSGTFGAVSADDRIGTCGVTNNQSATFLNAAATDTLALLAAGAGMMLIFPRRVVIRNSTRGIQMRYGVALLTISIGMLVSATTTRAQTTYVWQDTTNSWTTPTAWSPNGPANWFAGDRLNDTLVSFGSRATILKQPNLDNNILVRGISIDNSQAAWDISSSFGALNLGADGLSVTGLGTKTTTLSASVHLTTAQTWTVGEGMTVNATNTFSDSGNFTKAGPGELILAGDSTHTGTITATAGKLVLKGNRSAATGFVRGEGAVIQIANGAVLGNGVGFQASQSGTAGANTNSPHIFGDSPGHVSIMGTMEVEEDGIVQFDIAGLAAGIQYDRVDVHNLRLAQAGEAFLDLVVSGFTPSVGQPFFILNNQGSSPIVGQFTNAPQNSLISSGGHFFTITYFADADTLSLAGGNDIALISVASPVPEPATSLLLMLAAAGWSFRRRRAA